MEQASDVVHDDNDNLGSNQDVNFDEGTEAMNQSSLPTDVEAEFVSLTIEEMQSRLAIGQSVPDELVAYGLYSIYARAKGFSVRKGNIERFTDGSGIRAKDFICSCEGNKDEKRSILNIPISLRPTFRCKCKAKIRVARLKGQNWRVTGFNKEHTHDMYPPDQTYLLRSSRRMSPEMEECVEAMVKCGIPAAKAYDFLQSFSHGRENVGCTKKDIYNSLSRTKNQSRIESGDAAELVQYFIEKSNKEPFFYWNVERDENKRLMNLFFRDYRCNIDYEYFGDVLSVDTTYKTNKYNMICCLFVGINHHKQSVMFGFAFMSDETESSFEWLFRTFLESMSDKQPETIFTDQCQAMMNAIATVFPFSHHRLCQWHINQNAPSHFGNLKGNRSFKNLWHKCMNGCYEEEEFEETWRKMMTEYPIGDENWFDLMYGLRHKWAAVFSCHRFSAGLKATSRSESANAAIKRKFGKATSSLYDCIIAFEQLQESWRMDEKEKDTRSHHGKLPVGENTWLKNAADLYTMELFTLFQKEVSESMNFIITEQKEVVGTSLMCFTMKSRGEISRIISVQFDTETSSVNCICHKFETFGILCSHALKVLDRVGMENIPEKYIMKRWTKSVTSRICDAQHVNGHGSSVASSIAFVRETIRSTYDLAMRAQFYKETRCILTESLESAKSKLNAWFQNFTLTGLDAANDLNADEDKLVRDDMLVRDPQLVKSRGITDVRARHWDVKKKKRKGKDGSSKRTTKCTKHKVQSSQTIEGGEHAAQDARVQTLQGLKFFNQPDIVSRLNANSPPYPISFIQGTMGIPPSQYAFAYPSQRASLVSQQSPPRPLHAIDQMPAMPFVSPVLTNKFPWSYPTPVMINHGVGEDCNMGGSVENRNTNGVPKFL